MKCRSPSPFGDDAGTTYKGRMLFPARSNPLHREEIAYPIGMISSGLDMPRYTTLLATT